METREAKWREFLDHLGGAQELCFAMTRQSGRRWNLLQLTARDRDRGNLRELIHQGVVLRRAFHVGTGPSPRGCLVLFEWCRGNAAGFRHKLPGILRDASGSGGAAHGDGRSSADIRQ